jgi:hypothetical protein
MSTTRRRSGKQKRKRGALEKHQYGGRATAGGVGYEVHVAAFLATKMLVGDRCAVWSSISGSDIAGITMQAPEAVDDVVLILRGQPEAFVFISAKRRMNTIPLTPKSPAFVDTVNAFVRQFLKLPLATQTKSRFVWAVPSSAGTSAAHDLPLVLDSHRDDDSSSFSGFQRGRAARERKAIDSLVGQVKEVWKKDAGKSPSDVELRAFLRMVHIAVYDFDGGLQHVQQAESDIHFGTRKTDEVHIARTEELSALVTAAKAGHLLITGEPGCGKSGLIHPLAGTLQRKGFPVVLLLAEEVFGRDWKGSANLPGLAHALDEVLANWPNGSCGFLITDALDAVRDPETQKMLHRLLQDVKNGQSEWIVAASVREFDLKHSRELREAFPGEGVAGHSFNEFSGVAHFHLTSLAESKLDELVALRSDIRPFIESARKNAKSGAIHRSPFFLRLQPSSFAMVSARRALLIGTAPPYCYGNSGRPGS